ncbi:hypothetical protein J6590_073113 [Homalodisca vitripennis]|nr:hypothetical protein J6590_073113 [Homalodisca vitripennis]
MRLSHHDKVDTSDSDNVPIISVFLIMTFPTVSEIIHDIVESILEKSVSSGSVGEMQNELIGHGNQPISNLVPGGGNDDDNEAVKGVTSCNGVDNSDTGTDTPLPAGPVRPELDLDTCGLVTCSHTEPRFRFQLFFLL